MTPWIKVEHTTPDKPEVVAMAAALGIDQDAVFGKLVRLWIWADANSCNGNALTVTEAWIDRHTHQPGLARAMRACGWLMGQDGSLTFPGFDRHNGSSAKERATTNRRVAQHRSNARAVTGVTPGALQKPLPEEEIDSTTLSPARDRGCTLEEAHAYATAYNNGAGLAAGRTIPIAVATLWHDNRTSSGWIDVSKGVEIPIADWQANLRVFAHHYARHEIPSPGLNSTPKSRHASPSHPAPRSDTANTPGRYAS